MYRVGMIPYSNMAPFRELGPPPDSVFVEAVPSISIEMLKKGEILAAPAPVGAMPGISDIVEYAGNFGIAAKGNVQSVLLFSSIPFNEFDKDKFLRITSQTATSVRLLYLLLGYKNGFNSAPALAKGNAKAHGELLIGDDALIRQYNNSDNYRFIYDLSGLWYEAKSLPFVFARWVVRKDAPKSFKNTLNSWLEQMTDREELLINQSAPKEAKRLKIDTSLMITYLKGMNRVIDAEAIRGQELFLYEIKKLRRNKS